MSRRLSKIAMLAAFAIAFTASVNPALATTSTSQVADQAGSNTEAYLNGQTLRDGATVADGTVLQVGTSALLNPGFGAREIHTTYDSTTIYQAGTAIAPEGWKLAYSTDHGDTWVDQEPTPASAVTDIKAYATGVAAGLISGYSQSYSSETTSAVPAAVFNASSAGDGWGVTFLDKSVFNVYHHNAVLDLDCHKKSNGASCYQDAQPRRFNTPDGADFWTSPRSLPVADAQTGKLYIMVVPRWGQFDGKTGVECIDVSDSANPVSCGFTPLTDGYNNNVWQSISELTRQGNKYYGVASEQGAVKVVCYDSATNAACPESGVPTTGNYNNAGYSARLSVVGNSLYVANYQYLDCFNLSDLSTCAGGQWPRYEDNLNPYNEFLQHEDTTGVVDGFCQNSWCMDLSGQQTAYTRPFSSPFDAQWQEGVVVNHKLYAAGNDPISCFDYLTNAFCTNWDSSNYAGGNRPYTYHLAADPTNSACIWWNSNDGLLGNFSALTGEQGCKAVPVINLDPSQFAPRYSCSSADGIFSWDNLKISNLVGGGTAGQILLTVRTAQGTVVPGWQDVPVGIEQDFSMRGLDVSASGSRPTFSFAFTGITGGDINSATISLDYQGKGPELCSSVKIQSGGASLPISAAISGQLVDSVGGSTRFDSVRNLNIGSANGENQFLLPASAPQSLVVAGLNTSARLTFGAPTQLGGSPLIGYKYSLDGGSTWNSAQSVIDNNDGTFSIVVKRLTAGQTYQVRVAAVTTLGRGQSASSPMTVQYTDPAHIGATPVNRGPIYLQINNSNNLPYSYQVSPSSVCTVSANVVTLVAKGSCSVVTRQAGDATHIATRAASSFRVLAAQVDLTVPGLVQDLNVISDDQSVVLVWNAPLANGGSAITDYRIEYRVGSSYVPFNDGVSTVRTARITGLTNGQTYAFRVAAVNSIGRGPYMPGVEAAAGVTPDMLPTENDGNSEPAYINNWGPGQYTATNDPSVQLSWDNSTGGLVAQVKGNYSGYINVDASFTVGNTSYSCSQVFGILKPVKVDKLNSLNLAKVTAQRAAAMAEKTSVSKQFCTDLRKLNPARLNDGGSYTKEAFLNIKAMNKSAAELKSQKAALKALKGYNGVIKLVITRYRAWPSTMFNVMGWDGQGNKVPMTTRETYVYVN